MIIHPGNGILEQFKVDNVSTKNTCCFNDSNFLLIGFTYISRPFSIKNALLIDNDTNPLSDVRSLVKGFPVQLLCHAYIQLQYSLKQASTILKNLPKPRGKQMPPVILIVFYGIRIVYSLHTCIFDSRSKVKQ